MLPEKFLSRMRDLLGEEYPAFIDALENGEAVRAVHVNTGKMSVETFLRVCPWTLSPLSYAKDGFLLQEEKIGNHPLHHAGAVYAQDPGAMSTVNALPIGKGWRVADLCAAPGGKSAQLSAAVGETGVLLSNEIMPSRCKILAGNMERLGAGNVTVSNTDTRTLATWFPSYFDLVLADAPCSGEGMFRKYDYAAGEWSEEEVCSCAERQAEILDNAAQMVKKDGWLLYSTCTFSLEENEKNADAFLSRHPDFTVKPVADTLAAVTAEGIVFPGCVHPELMQKTRRFYPHLQPGEGQYICLFHRQGGDERDLPTYRDAATPLSRAEQTLVLSFFRDIFDENTDRVLARFDLSRYRETVVLKSRGLPLPEHGIYLPGINVGSIQKGRVEPHHQLFSALGQYFVRQADFLPDAPEIERYLHGDLFPSTLADGYGVITVAGAPIGGIKIVQGVAKNHYPKGLRLL